MVEPMQKLVQKYFEEQGYFLRSNLKYKYNKNHSDIDLIGINNKGEGLVAEVKNRSIYYSLKEAKVLVEDYYNDSIVDKKVREILGKLPTRKVLAVAWLHSEPKKSEEIMKYAAERGVEIITLDEVIGWFFKNLVSDSMSYEDDSLQLIRSIKEYYKYDKASFLNNIKKT